jgi:hypothetical protein
LTADKAAEAESARQENSGSDHPGRDGSRHHTMRHWITSFRLLPEDRGQIAAKNQAGRKAFFFEKKNQKTFTLGAGPTFPAMACKFALAQN